MSKPNIWTHPLTEFEIAVTESIEALTCLAAALKGDDPLKIEVLALLDKIETL